MPQTHFYCIILICPANAVLQVAIHTVFLFKENAGVPWNKMWVSLQKPFSMDDDSA